MNSRRLKKQRSTKASLSLQPEPLEDRVLLAVDGPRLISIQPDIGDVLREGVVRHTSPRELTLVFNESQTIDVDTLGGVRVVRAGFDGAFDGVTDVIVEPGFIGVDPLRTNEVVVRFAESLPDDLYQIQVFGIDDEARGIVALRNTDGDAFIPEIKGADRTTLGFELDLGAQVTSIVPQPVVRNADGSLSQARNRIDVYFNDDDLSAESASNISFYQLIFTNRTATNVDDVIHTPSRVDYDPVADRAVLTFASNLDELSTGEGIYRLRIGTAEEIPVEPIMLEAADDAGSSFDTATFIGTVSSSVIISSEIKSDESYPLDYPGSNDEPGHREISSQNHLLAEADSAAGIQVLAYNFREDIGKSSDGKPVFNLITELQKRRAREVFDLWSEKLGVRFVETESDGFIIATGDLRLLDPAADVGSGGVLGMAGLHPDPDFAEQPIAIMDGSELWDDNFGPALDINDPFGQTPSANRFSWMTVAMHEIGHLLGLGHTDELEPFTIMAGIHEDTTALSNTRAGAEPVYPGVSDVIHGQYLYRPEGNDIDVYRFDLPTSGVFTAEVIAERLADSSLLDSVITLYRQAGTKREIIARNDDYFSEDPFIERELPAGTYFIAVSSTGNVDFDPTVEDSGFGGLTEGEYDLRIDFRPRVDNFLVDETGTAFDGNADGIAGGVFNAWVQIVGPEKTVFVDKAATVGGDGSIDRPFNSIQAALVSPNGPQSGEILRIVGNGGADGDVHTLGDNLAYEIGRSNGRILSDGATLNLPKGVTLMVDAGAVFKLFKSTINVGSSAVGIDRSESAIQVLGIPGTPVVFTSYDDESIGVDTNPRITNPDPGDWGGIVIQNDVDRAEGRFDYEQSGIYLNRINNADIRYGGGNVTIDSVQQVITPIHLTDARPTISFNQIRFSADAALSANPDSFEETNFIAVDSLGIDYQELRFTPDYDRVGPDIRGNRLTDNSINGVFVRIQTPAGNALERMTVTGRWDDTDIVHVLPENLLIESRPGGPLLDAATGQFQARPDAGLKIDPNLVVKLDGSRIEIVHGAQLLAEGNPGQRIVFTSLNDQRFGAGGTFVTSAPTDNRPSEAQPGDWGGIYVAPTSSASIANSVIAFGGGLTRVEGSFAAFNPVESHQGKLRLAKSVLERNANGRGGQTGPNRIGRGVNGEGVIFVRGAQPVVLDNIFRANEGFFSAVINIDVNSLDHRLLQDYGRSTGRINLETRFRDNHGPLIRENRLTGNSINGMQVRGGALAGESIWDDTDIVHVLYDEVLVTNVHTFGGLRLESSPDESLVVKMYGNDAGFKASGRPLDIEDRIGGSVKSIGTPGHPVVLTSLADDTVGAGFDPFGRPQNDTDGFRRAPRVNQPGSFQIDLNFGPRVSEYEQTMQAIQDAARIWEWLLDDPIRLTFDIELADLGDGTLGVAQPEFVTIDYDAVRDALIADARPGEDIAAQLPTFADLNVALPVDQNNPFTVDSLVNLTTANAKALGFDIPLGTPSDYDPNEVRDARIEFNFEPVILRNQFVDQDRQDGIQPLYSDLVGTAIHEIGHALGFITAVDDVANGVRNVRMTPLDFFRLEPGKGANDFTSAQRALDPALDHVLHDGGYYDPFGINVPNLTKGDIPISSTSDGTQAAHWLSNLPFIGIMNASGDSGREENILEADRVAFDLIGWDVVGNAVPGDWRGITLTQFSNDRNVATVLEQESPEVVAPGINATPGTAQVLGQLGRGEKDSDENLRLGFEVHGFLNSPNDVDVYSFDAAAGTQVWFDIDRTAQILDSVIELVDSQGNVLVRSNDSLNDTLFSETVEAVPDVIAHGLQYGYFNTKDHYSYNIKDSGMRVVLPGPEGLVNTYHVRVRSNGEDLDSLSTGLTSGFYQLQIRLRQIDEHPGSTVQFSDIRYAADAVRVTGLPSNSPLTGETSERLLPNNETALPHHSKVRLRFPMGADALGPYSPPALLTDFTDAINLGNILTQDAAAISVAGQLSPLESPFDSDWFVFSIAYEDVASSGGTVDVVFDADFADGLSRPDLNLSVYSVRPTTPVDPGFFGEPALPSNASGPELFADQLIFTSNRDSRITDDQPRPLQGDDVAQLNQGSVGRHDPFLGPVTLAPGIYAINIVPDSQVPIEQEQFFEELPSDPFYREEPNPNVIRIADDHISGDPPLITATLDDPVVPVLFNRRSIVPFTLGDVDLFVSSSSGLMTIDPFTGKREANIGVYVGGPGGFPTVGDIAIRDNPVFQRWVTTPDGISDEITDATRRQRLHAFGTSDGSGVLNDATVGNYLWLDFDPISVPPPAPGQVLVRGTGEEGAITDDGLETYINFDDPANPLDPAADPPPEPWGVNANIVRAGTTMEGVGVIYDAITFGLPNPIGDIDVGYAVGHRSADGQFDNSLSNGLNPGDDGYGVIGAAGITNILYKFNAIDGSIISATGEPRPPEELFAVPNGNPPDVDNPTGVQPNAGTQLVEAGVLNTNVCFRVSTSLYEACPRNPDDDPDLMEEFGGNITGIAFVGSSLYGVSDGGHLYRITGQDTEAARARYVGTIYDEAGETVPFQGLTAGPKNVEGGAYRSVLFGITRGGDLYAFDTDAVPQSIFVDGQTWISTGASGAVGLEFGTVDENLWTISGDRAGDPGHTGGFELYFGEDSNFGTREPRHYDFLGSPHGSVVSNEFSLEGYSVDDKPTLYFTYLALTEKAGGPNRDTFRVFIADDSADTSRGQWHLLGSNMPNELGDVTDVDPDDTVFTNTLPLFDSTFQDVPNANNNFIADGQRGTLPPVEGTEPFAFDGDWAQVYTDTVIDERVSVWRQAKIDLSDFVGSDSLRLRFDFSTAGSFDTGGANTTGGTELRAIDSSKINDGDTFIIDGTTFEFDLGATVRGVPGKRIVDGETLSLTDADGAVAVLEFDRDGSIGANRIGISVDDTLTSNDVADLIEAAVTTSGLNVTVHRTAARLNFENAIAMVQSPGAGLSIEGNIGVSGGIPVVIHGGMDEADVAEAMKQPIADTFANGNVAVIKGYGNSVQIIGHAVDDPGPLGMTERLPGDNFGAFTNPLRYQNNSRTLFFEGDEERFYEVLNEGIYVDDILIGFQKSGSVSTTFRNENYPRTGAEPQVFIPEKGTTVDDPFAESPILVGEYQLEIRRSTEAAQLGFSYDPTIRFSQSVSLPALSGSDLFDGKTFRLYDGIKTATFEFEDADFSDGVDPGHVAVEFTSLDTSSDVAVAMRDAINGQDTIDVLAALSDGEVTDASFGKASIVDLFGNVVVVDEAAPNGIPAIIYDLFGDWNVDRDQGQVIIDSNTISNTRSYGIVVEPGHRDLPTYSFYDPANDISDAQFSFADYTPYPGPVRNLGKVNAEQLAPGVVVSNNVVAFSGEGGIHYGGGRTSVLVTAPIVGESRPPIEITTGDRILVTDHNGNSRLFEFQFNVGVVRDTGPLGLIPIQVMPSVGCDTVYGTLCAFRPDVVTALIHAFEYSDLDINVIRGEADAVFLEGAVSVVGINVPFTSFVQFAEEGSVSFGRIVNNTLVGLGGTFETDAVYEPDDFADVGILVEGAASPTLMNNVIVNFEHGLQTDATVHEIVRGGNLYQNNLRNTVNIDPGDFVLQLPNDEQLFVDWQRGNFYPSSQSKLIDNAVQSLPDRGDFYVPMKAAAGISESPILAPTYDVLGQLRIDDPSVDPIGGVGENVFVDRGAIDRVDFVGPVASLQVPLDNDGDGLDQNPEVDVVRIDRDDLTRFVIRLSDFGDAIAPTGTGIDDQLVTSDSVLILRDGQPLIEGVDYRFDYQPTTNEIQLTPQAGVWLDGYRYRIILTNDDQHVLTPPAGPSVADGDFFEVASLDAVSGLERRVVFEFESGYTLEVPQPLTLVVPAGSSGLSAIQDRDLFTLNDGLNFVSFEFDSNGVATPGRVAVPFSPSDTPEEVADAIVQAIQGTGFGLNPQSLGGGRVHIGGPANLRLDVSLSSLVVEGISSPIVDGEIFSFDLLGSTVNFEFDKDGQSNSSNIAIPVDDNMTQDEIANAIVKKLAATDLPIAPRNIGNGRIHLGGTSDLGVRVNLSSLNVVGQPGVSTAGFETIPISYVPSDEFHPSVMASLIRDAVSNSGLDGLQVFIDDGDRVIIKGATDVAGIENVFVPGIRDFAGNPLQTNQDTEPFSVIFDIDLPAPFDFGDAPDPPYATRLESDGARHVVVPNVHLGPSINAELDGTPTVAADGDSGDDGITFASDVVRGGRVPIVVNASANGFLDGWLDVNRDGVFDPVAERVFDSVPVARLFNALRMNVPDTATVGETYARFRFSTVGNLAPTGRAPNGEVEDYQVTIVDIEPPTAQPDEYDAVEDVELVVSAAEGVLRNDLDPQGDELAAKVLALPSNGSLTLNADGSFTYVPQPDFSGVDSFTYLATDDVQDSEIVTVTINVLPQPDPPVAGDDDATVAEDNVVTINLLLNDRDPDGALVRSSVQIVRAPSNGTVEVDANGVATYTPNPNYFGRDEFTYTVSDEEGAISNEARVTLTVLDVNDPPVAENDVLSTRRNVATVIDLLANDSDIDGEINPNSIIITFNPKSGSVVVNGDGTVTFTPLLGFLGTDTFRYVVRDDDGAPSNEASVTINVGDNNILPVAVDDFAATSPATPVVIDVLANDFDQDGSLTPSSLTVVQAPGNGTAIVENGKIRYTPSATFIGEDSFRYTVRDNDNDTSNVAIVTVTVETVTAPWQNSTNALDVNDDGNVSPLDALLVINELNSPAGSRPLPAPPITERPFTPPPFVDVNGDDFLAPLDALLVINFLNQQAQGVAAVPVDRSLSSFDVAAAFDIQPRGRASKEKIASVEQSFTTESQAPRRDLTQELDPTSVFQTRSLEAIDAMFSLADAVDDDDLLESQV